MVVEMSRLLDTRDTQDHAIKNDEELWSAPTRIIAAWGDETSVSYHGNSKSRASVRLFAEGDDSVDDGVGLREDLESESDGYFEVREDNYVIPARETTYHDICKTYDELFDVDSQDEDGVAVIGGAPFFTEETEQYLQHFHHFTVYVASSCDERAFPRSMIYMWAPGKSNTMDEVFTLNLSQSQLVSSILYSQGTRDWQCLQTLVSHYFIKRMQWLFICKYILTILT